MPTIKGSGQGSGGKGLLITATTVGAAQTLHTAVAGRPYAELVRLQFVNNSTAGVLVHVRFEPSDMSAAVEIQEMIPAQGALHTLIPDFMGLLLNEAMVVKVYADTPSVIIAQAQVATETRDAVGDRELLQTGEITLVQNTDAFRMNGVASSAVEADHQIMVPVPGILTNLRMRARAGVGGGATATITVRVNGADTALAVAIAAAQGVNIQTDADAVPVAAGDLVVINAHTDNAGAPADTVFGSVEYLPTA